jgi:glycosyltransferase involved in cell wall biosynthesis
VGQPGEESVSVVIPTFNAAQFLPRSGLPASSAAHPDVVVDDWSTDASRAVLERLIASDNPNPAAAQPAVNISRAGPRHELRRLARAMAQPC